jgi:hypothetical protein
MKFIIEYPIGEEYVWSGVDYLCVEADSEEEVYETIHSALVFGIQHDSAFTFAYGYKLYLSDYVTYHKGEAWGDSNVVTIKHGTYARIYMPDIIEFNKWFDKRVIK